MTTTVEQPKQDKSNGTKVRVLATIIMKPEQKVSKAGNEYTKLVLATSNGLEKGADVIWNATVMKPLVDKLPKDLFKKFSYGKFNGLGTHRPYKNKKGEEVMAHDMLVDSVTLPDGTIVYEKEKKETQDEDAPF